MQGGHDLIFSTNMGLQGGHDPLNTQVCPFWDCKAVVTPFKGGRDSRKGATTPLNVCAALHSRVSLSDTRDPAGLPRGESDFFDFFSFLVTVLRRFLSLKLSDTRVYEPQIRALLVTTTNFCAVVVLYCQPTGQHPLYHRNDLVDRPRAMGAWLSFPQMPRGGRSKSLSGKRASLVLHAAGGTYRNLSLILITCCRSS